MDHAVFLLPIMIQRMLDVPHGTGISKFAFNAQTTGFLIKTMYVYLYPINAPPSIEQVPAYLATKDIT
jgi:hypothetical protein